MDLEPYYTIFEIFEIFVISKPTVYNWLHGNEVQRPVIPRDGWIRIPGSGQIRIKGEIVKKLMGGECSLRESWIGVNQNGDPGASHEVGSGGLE